MFYNRVICSKQGPPTHNHAARGEGKVFSPAAKLILSVSRSRYDFILRATLFHIFAFQRKRCFACAFVLHVSFFDARTKLTKLVASP